ncbi:MAG: hypothetical protein WC835_00900 [Candidatus Paceibacterota bacterium]|jgi:hypothetical protein
MNFKGTMPLQKAPDQENPTFDIGAEASNDPAFFEEFADRLFGVRAAIEGFMGTEKEKEYLKSNFVLFRSVLKNINSQIDEAEGKGDIILSKNLKALKTSLKAEVREIEDKKLI